MTRGSYLHTGALFTITQTPSFSQGLSGQKASTSGSSGWVMLLVVVVDVVVLSVSVVAVGPGPGLVVLALVVVTTLGGTLGSVDRRCEISAW